MKKNLIFPLVVSSLFMPSIEAIERTTDLNWLENENNIYEAVDILIAEGGGGSGGGGMKISEKKENDLKKAIKSLKFFAKKKAEAEARGESTEKIDRKIKKYINKIIKLSPEAELIDEIIGVEIFENDIYKTLNKKQLNTIKQKTNSMMEEILDP